MIPPRTPAWITGLSLIALRDIELTMWHLAQAGFRSKDQQFHALNAQLLSRPAIEITCRSLLFAYKPEYIRAWEIEDWETMILTRHFNEMVFSEAAERGTNADHADRSHAEYTAALGLDSRAEELVIKRFSGDASEDDRSELNSMLGKYRKLPRISTITIGDTRVLPLLSGSKDEPAGQILYRYYKFLCHPTHGGKNSLIQRATFSGVIKSGVSVPDLVDEEINQDTVWLVMTLQLLLCTVASYQPCTDIAVNDTGISRKLTECWALLGQHSALGRELHDFWYKPRFGILGS